jgi:hypothetical protein
VPPDAVATAAHATTWQEDSVGLTAVMPPASVDVLLRDSRVIEPLAPGPAEYRSGPPDGSELPTGPAVTSVTESFPDVVRTMLIERSDASRAVVHVVCWAS